MAMASISFRVSLWLLVFATFVKASSKLTETFDVRDFGAVSDGKTDSSKAFQKAWKEACAMQGKPRILIVGSYLVGPLKFKGPCRGVMVVELKGQLLASTDLNAYKRNWIEFQYIDGLKISGGGKIDGQGAKAWPHNKCHEKRHCKLLPSSLVFSFVNNAKITGISSINSKLFHMNVFASADMNFQSIRIAAPAESPNTDGIHIGNSRNINVSNSVISTGDDCVSIGPGSSSIRVSGVHCGPGHGISIGSLGKSMNEKDVAGVIVENCILSGTDNGVRIKTWENSPKATSASHFVYENITMNNVSNPIVIDQKYCPHGGCAVKSPSRVRISDIKFRKIRGTSSSLTAINLQCSDAIPCKGVELSDINLKYTGIQPATSLCVNVHGKSNGNVKPAACI